MTAKATITRLNLNERYPVILEIANINPQHATTLTGLPASAGAEPGPIMPRRLAGRVRGLQFVPGERLRIDMDAVEIEAIVTAVRSAPEPERVVTEFYSVGAPIRETFDGI